MEGSFSTHGIRNTSGNTTNRNDIQFPPYSLVHFYLLVFDYFFEALTSLLIVFGFLLGQAFATMALLVSF